MIRFLLIALLLFLYLLLGIPVLLVEKLVAKINPHARDISCLRMVQWAFKLMLWITGADISYIGRENVPKDRAVLYVGNHNSYFDILLTYSQCPGLTGYVAKSEMLRFPLLRDWMKRLYCVFLDRSDLRAGMQMILTCIDYIKNGISICIFPEGTRSKDGQMQPFHEGSLKMACQDRLPHYSDGDQQLRADLRKPYAVCPSVQSDRRIWGACLSQRAVKRRPEISGCVYAEKNPGNAGSASYRLRRQL